jgi:hypothetical protein
MLKAGKRRRTHARAAEAEPGVIVASARGGRSADIALELRAAIEPEGLAALLVYFSSRYDPDELAYHLDLHFPGVPIYGCSTAGELAPEGISEAGAVAIGLPADDFTVIGRVTTDIETFAIESAADLVRDMQRELARSGPERPDGASFAMLLIDGLCRREELVVSALYNALDDVPLVGGSAGDDLMFQKTWLIHNGRAVSGAFILLLVNTSRPFRLFKVDHFEPTGVRMVVTGAVAEERRITELNAEPAAQEYARVIGADNGSLDTFSFAAHPVVVRVGGEYYARSIGRVNEDGSLSFFCAIDEGLVLTAARPLNMLDCMETALAEIDRELDGPELTLGFDCVYRRLDAEQRQTMRQLSEIYRRHKVVGFNTYGEQYRAMHLNQTFTGVAIGRARPKT